MLPGSPFAVQVFPTFLQVYDLSALKQATEMQLDIEGPVEDFTVMMDLEKPSLLIWGQGAKGYFRYRLQASADKTAILLSFERPSKESVVLQIQEPTSAEHQQLASFERLSLGSHKAQDWCLMRRRRNLEEILPLWYALSQYYPSLREETDPLAAECRNLIKEKQHDRLGKALYQLFQVRFRGMLVPQGEDNLHQGFNLPSVSTGSPLRFFEESRALIRRLFLYEKQTSSATILSFLPSLPVEFHCGRFLGLKSDKVGVIDMEWSKKKLRRVELAVAQSAIVLFKCSSSIKQYRLRRGDKDRGQDMAVGIPIEISAGEQISLDRFTQ
jgi:hypothetical protein